MPDTSVFGIVTFVFLTASYPFHSSDKSLKRFSIASEAFASSVSLVISHIRAFLNNSGDFIIFCTLSLPSHDACDIAVSVIVPAHSDIAHGTFVSCFPVATIGFLTISAPVFITFPVFTHAFGANI
jgi:hypothetical protein